MSKYNKAALPLVLPLIMGVLLLLNALDNPRLASAHGTDFIKLVAAGLCFGTVFGIGMAGFVASRRARDVSPDRPV